MIFVLGAQERSEPDGMTADSDYTCPECDYHGRLLLYVLQVKPTLFFVPLGAWRDGGGVMVCPSCGNDYVLGRRKYRAMEKLALEDSARLWPG